MRFDGNSGSAPNYEPNSFNGPTEDPIYTERPRPVTGTIDRHNHRIDDDYYSQPGNLFRLMKPDAKERLIGNIVSSLKNAPEHIQKRQVWHFTKADPAYGAGVAQGLGLDASTINAAKKEEVFAD
jgi:catalase